MSAGGIVATIHGRSSLDCLYNDTVDVARWPRSGGSSQTPDPPAGPTAPTPTEPVLAGIGWAHDKTGPGDASTSSRAARRSQLGAAGRIIENLDVFDFALTATTEPAAIGTADPGVRGGPKPAPVTLAT